MKFLISLLTGLAICTSATIANAGHFSHHTLKTAGTAITYRLFVPNHPAQPAPLFVALHGCFQDGAAFASGIQLNKLAEAHGFYVLYPEQTYDNNAWKCWNWFFPANQTRGPGEMETIVHATRNTMAKFNIDTNRVYAAGLSAGSAMAANMIACYSELFSGGILSSGLEFGAAQDEIEAHDVMTSGPGRRIETAVKMAYDCSPTHPHPLTIAIFHGNEDTTVSIINAQRTRAQFVGLNMMILPNIPVVQHKSSIAQTDPYKFPAVTEDYLYNNVSLVKAVIVQGMGHAWSGGAATCSYMEPKGVDETTIAVDYLFNHTVN